MMLNAPLPAKVMRCEPGSGVGVGGGVAGGAGVGGGVSEFSGLWTSVIGEVLGPKAAYFGGTVPLSMMMVGSPSGGAGPFPLVELMEPPPEPFGAPPNGSDVPFDPPQPLRARSPKTPKRATRVKIVRM